MSYLLPWLAAAVLAAAMQAASSEAATEKDYIDRTPSDQLVWCQIEGQNGGVRYYILADGRIYPGQMRGDKHVVWHRAEPLLVSEYPFGGPKSARLPLVEARKIDYQTEPPPEALKRSTVSK